MARRNSKFGRQEEVRRNMDPSRNARARAFAKQSRANFGGGGPSAIGPAKKAVAVDENDYNHLGQYALDFTDDTIWTPGFGAEGLLQRNAQGYPSRLIFEPPSGVEFQTFAKVSFDFSEVEVPVELDPERMYEWCGEFVWNRSVEPSDEEVTEVFEFLVRTRNIGDAQWYLAKQRLVEIEVNSDWGVPKSWQLVFQPGTNGTRISIRRTTGNSSITNFRMKFNSNTVRLPAWI